MTLDEICIKQGADKGTKHHVYGHGYAPHYDHFFTPMREQPIKMLEIGVGGGESIKTWLEYFTVAKVHGVDIVHGTNPWNTLKAETNPRYTFVTGDQSVDIFWKCFIADYGKDWDIIIDDGGHFSNQVITSFNSLWEHVKSGGLYCIEDLAVAYGAGSIFVVNGQNHMDFIKEKLDVINQGSGIEFMYCSKELAILRKA